MPGRAAFVDPRAISLTMDGSPPGAVDIGAASNHTLNPTLVTVHGRLRFQYSGLAASRPDMYNYWSPWAACAIRRLFDDAVFWGAGFRYGGADGIMGMASRGQVCWSSQPYAAKFQDFFGDRTSQMGLLASRSDEFPSISFMQLNPLEGALIRPMLERAEDQR